MSRHVHRRSPKLSLAAAVVTAIALVSCGGSMDGETVSGSSAVAPKGESSPLGSDAGFLGASATAKVPMCHKGDDKLVPEDAVSDHLLHGDGFGTCDAPIFCPCFTAEFVLAASECTTGTLSRTCQLEPAYLKLACDLGSGSTPAHIFVAQAVGQEFSCIGPEGSHDGIDSEEYEACVAIIENSGPCPYQSPA